ncbi:MAG: methyltransferase [Lentimicrobium sp.]|jgi:tRNA1Val (adenine37-N6)-methyltransferase|nr:methyltransferase [Lentimicrobium sp.]MDD2526675.1 methyltransferase [Lentimicrobiaceae bacterium]MDD4596859.1 methyltransferase [Lentimicrobiaceae bacterium]MDY0025281.1 methyltransferase [Lentimicrobium sp.]
MSFTFKQFTVDDSNCPMKVGTDAVLLGAWADFKGAKTLLDIGTGCGILALMAAQRSEAYITAIDVHDEAIQRATLNFLNTLWGKRLNAEVVDFMDFALTDALKYDYIISNPPFFSRSLKAPSPDRNLARHNDNSLPFKHLISGASRLLCKSGRFGLVLPAIQAEPFIVMIKAVGLKVVRRLNVQPYPDAAPNRVLLEFSSIYQPVHTGELAIRERSGNYTDSYQKLTRDFYLNF